MADRGTVSYPTSERVAMDIDEFNRMLRTIGIYGAVLGSLVGVLVTTIVLVIWTEVL